MIKICKKVSIETRRKAPQIVCPSTFFDNVGAYVCRYNLKYKLVLIKTFTSSEISFNDMTSVLYEATIF